MTPHQLAAELGYDPSDPTVLATCAALCASANANAEIERELKKIDDQIDALYWAFTRQARAKPPVVVRPDLYERRTALRRALRDARGPFGAVRPDRPGQ